MEHLPFLEQLVKSNNLDNLFDDLFSIEKLVFINQTLKYTICQLTNIKFKKMKLAFLSANTWDVSGGGNYGFNSIWVNRNNNIFDNLDYKPQNEIKNLKELLNII
jgi:2-haloacid dehalogenase